jgi:CRP/FNR family cyclic AMP-dependent transcriptional regulator
MVRANARLRTFLRSVPVLSGLEGRSLENVISSLETHAFPAGTTLFSEGELGRTMFILASGEVEVRRRTRSGRDVPIVRLGEGECFGEMALVELQPRSATCVAIRKTVCYSLNNLALYKLFHNDTYAFTIILQNICRLLSRRLRKADSRISEFVEAQRARGPKRARRGD